MYDKADDIRVKETQLVVRGFVLKGVGDSFAKMIPTFCTVIVIWVYNSVYDVPLTIGETFYVISLFNLFMTPINIFLFSFINVASASVSAIRIMELSKIINSELLKDSPNLPRGSIEFKSASFGWLDVNYQKIFEPTKVTDDQTVRGDTLHILKNITTRIEPGSFNVVVGKVGSGKTSFILACLGEILGMGGSVEKNGTFAYIAQEAFLINDTVRNNILFGIDYEENSYREAIDLSQLNQDLKELPGGEFTEIGERGINLSGGQKQRVMIARAIYANRDINLIDDSLSALDAYVGKKVYEGVFKGFMGSKTRIMVTHHLHLLNDSAIDKIIFIDKGQIACEGKLADIADDPRFQDYYSELKKKEEEKTDETEVKEKKVDPKVNSEASLKNIAVINVEVKQEIQKDDKSATGRDSTTVTTV